MYAKVFSSIYDGTLREDWKALVTFQQLLVLADRGGFVDMTPAAIVARTGIPLDIIEPGLTALEQPDDQSRTPDEAGRRIERIDEHRLWGWRIINYEAYRDKRDAEHERFRNALRAKRFRDKRNGASRSVTVRNGSSPHTEADTDAVSEAKASSCPKTDSDDSLTVEQWTVEVFWPSYPRKEAKAKAIKAMRAVFKGMSGEREDALGQAILAGLRRHKAAWENKDREFIPLPASWINGRRWEDELDA